MSTFFIRQSFCVGLLCACVANAGEPHPADFGKTKDGKPIEIYTLKSGKGMTATLMTRGATLVTLNVPNAQGVIDDVILGFDDVAGYESERNSYFGCTTGRVCNRIANGKFSLDGKDYSLAINNDPNHLHGGAERSLDKVVWESRGFENDRGQGVAFSYTSPDGEEGYPGNLKIKVTYFVPKETNSLSIRYQVTTDQRTPVNLTNHAYFNLAGHGNKSILDHLLRLNADQYTPTDETLIPNGDIASVEGTPLDFRKSTTIGQRIDDLVNTAWLGYDHNFVLNAPKEGRRMRVAAILIDRESGRKLRISTTEPGVQFYSGNFLKGQIGKNRKKYLHQSACCLETQHFPDSINHANFPNTVLEPCETFTSQTILNFSVLKDDELADKPVPRQ